MPLAIGGSSAASRPPHGPFWVDVRDYGAKADNGVTDNSAAFQAAVDDLAAKMSGAYYATGVVFIPAAPQPYGVNKSVWVDSDRIEIRGEGWGSLVTMAGYNKHSVFIFGVRRVQPALVNGVSVPLTIGASNRPDLFGKLDASAVPAPHTAWGLRTNGNTFAQFQACPLSAGVATAASTAFSDNWGETSKLTLEFCVEPPDGQQVPVMAPLLGLGGTNPLGASPFVVSGWDSPNKLLVQFRTSDMDEYGPTEVRWFGVTIGSAAAPYRVAIQFDLDNAVCSAFVNGVQVAVTDQHNMSPTSAPAFAPGRNLKFATNDYNPFLIGSNGVTGTYGSSTGVDLRVYGLRLSNTIRYQNNGPGQRQTRADAPTTPVNDAWAYFGRDSHTICYLAGTDDPATAGRVVSVTHGDAVLFGTSSGIFMHSAVQVNVAKNAVRDLAISCGTGYGQAVSLGNILEMSLSNVKAYGGYHGVGSFNMTANYYVYLDKCDLQGVDSAYSAYYQLLYAKDVSFASSGRVTVRLLGCASRWDNVLVNRGSPVTECIFKASGDDYGGSHWLSNWVVDFEGETVSRAAIYCETHGVTPSTGLNLTNVSFGTLGPGASLVQLKDRSLESGLRHPCWLTVDNMQAWTSDYRAAFDVDGPLWRGEVKGVALTGPRLLHRQKWGATTGLALYEAKYVAPPREWPWYAGAHVLQVRSPADGQFAEWRCVASGAYGTPAPPAWVGLNPIPASKNGLAAYVLNNGYINVALS